LNAKYRIKIVHGIISVEEIFYFSFQMTAVVVVHNVKILIFSAYL